jgi:hypothetical protein
VDLLNSPHNSSVPPLAFSMEFLVLSTLPEEENKNKDQAVLSSTTVTSESKMSNSVPSSVDSLNSPHNSSLLPLVFSKEFLVLSKLPRSRTWAQAVLSSTTVTSESKTSNSVPSSVPFPASSVPPLVSSTEFLVLSMLPSSRICPRKTKSSSSVCSFHLSSEVSWEVPDNKTKDLDSTLEES